MEKKDKDDVFYSIAESLDASCAECVHYLGGACEVVKGQISPEYWCSYHEATRDVMS